MEADLDEAVVYATSATTAGVDVVDARAAKEERRRRETVFPPAVVTHGGSDILFVWGGSGVLVSKFELKKNKCLFLGN